MTKITLITNEVIIINESLVTFRALLREDKDYIKVYKDNSPYQPKEYIMYINKAHILHYEEA